LRFDRTVSAPTQTLIESIARNSFEATMARIFKKIADDVKVMYTIEVLEPTLQSR
jgi:hypothetical protein